MQQEELPNGLIRVYDYLTGLAGVYNPDGSFRHGVDVKKHNRRYENET